MKTQIFTFIFAACCIGNAQAQVAKSPVGVQLYSFREQLKLDVAANLAKVRAMGITQVESAGFYGLSAAEFKKLTDANGIKIAGVSAEFADLDNPEKIKDIIADAKATGADYVVCFWIPHTEGDFTLAETQRGIEVFNKAGKALAQHKLMLLYHPHGYEFRPYKDEYMIDQLIKKTNPLYVNYEMDINWVYHAGHNPVTWLKKYPTRWKAMHVKDRVRGTACNQFGRMDVEKNVAIGQGEVNIDDTVKMARKIGIKYFFIEDESTRSFEQTPLSIAYLRGLFN
jgi:sugar phosphate isomerase/epimerase